MRYCPERKFPSYAFRPGQNTHPNKEGGHSYGLSEVVSEQLSVENSDFLYAIDLYNHAFYWEAHVYLEAIWNFHKRSGPCATLCKAIIKLCAGCLKKELTQNDLSAKDHFKRSLELIEELNSSPLGSLDLLSLKEVIHARSKGIDKKIELSI